MLSVLCCFWYVERPVLSACPERSRWKSKETDGSRRIVSLLYCRNAWLIYSWSLLFGIWNFFTLEFALFLVLLICRALVTRCLRSLMCFTGLIGFGIWCFLFFAASDMLSVLSWAPVLSEVVGSRRKPMEVEGLFHCSIVEMLDWSILDLCYLEFGISLLWNLPFYLVLLSFDASLFYLSR